MVVVVLKRGGCLGSSKGGLGCGVVIEENYVLLEGVLEIGKQM